MNHDLLTSPFLTPLNLSLLQIRLDRVEFKGNIKAQNYIPYEKIRLPIPIATVFEAEKVNVSLEGYVNPPVKSRCYSSNGVILSRQHLGLPLPDSGPERNQLTNEEMIGEVGKLDALAQINLLLRAQKQLLLFLENKFSGALELSLPYAFEFAEFYCEIPSPTDLEAFFQSTTINVCKAIGATFRNQRDVTEVNERISNRGHYHHYWKVKSHSLTRGRDQEVNIKIYQKGTRVRFEVSFRKLKTRPMKLAKGELVTPEIIESACRILLNEMHLAAKELIEKLLPLFSSTIHQKINSEELRRKLKEFNAREVTADRYKMFDRRLQEEGVYDPSSVEADKRMSYRILQNLSNPEGGILEKVPFFDRKGNARGGYYKLKDNWWSIQPKKNPNFPSPLTAPPSTPAKN